MDVLQIGGIRVVVGGQKVDYKSYIDFVKSVVFIMKDWIVLEGF